MTTALPPALVAVAPELGGLAAPTLVVDLDAFDANIGVLRERARGLPIRLASKSVRVNALIERVLRTPGFSGLLCYSLDEALRLATTLPDELATDLVVAYPSVDRVAIARLAADAELAARVTLMIDSGEQLALIVDSARGPARLRVALDLDCGLPLGPRVRGQRFILGAHRSPLREPEQAAALARLVVNQQGPVGIDLVGLMFYDAQIAGVPDGVASWLMKRVSWAELVDRRRRVRAAVEKVAGPLQFVNAGGTGSLHLFESADATITDLAAGSGLFQPTLFDGYDQSVASAGLTPSLFIASPVVRKPRPDVAVVFAAGYVASGPPGWGRTPRPLAGLRYFSAEGPGEVQTPLQGRAARALKLGDPVWFRPAKAGETCERFDEVVLVSGGRVVERVPTYRGMGSNHG